MRISECDNVKDSIGVRTLCTINDIEKHIYYYNHESNVQEYMDKHPNELRTALVYVNCRKNDTSTLKRKIIIIYSTDWTARTIKMDKIIESYKKYQTTKTLQSVNTMLAEAMNYLFHYNKYDGVHTIDSVYDLILE